MLKNINNWFFLSLYSIIKFNYFVFIDLYPMSFELHHATQKTIGISLRS
ncbi:hypothetical protein XSR1_60057 [Xenorhabdus szentirmaii DSM 16338]|uniref:Uncharacterized protein n=1 Tax=Xenorhabdus szentirmaii DSM 16338 TaxID=1427518 RepID=W1J6C0_9GAMM|nr:hypothetical protein XSR1_60057 [Xenorhabdus szentirmaii DSM 16338]